MPRAGLTPLRVITEARVLAEEVGLERLTMNALAHRLGVKTPSLYKHIESLASLHRTISTIGARELVNELAHATRGLDGFNAIYAMSHAYRAWAHNHPSLYIASQKAPASGDGQHKAIMNASTRTISATIAASGIADPSERIDGARAALSVLHGFITLESNHAFGLNADIDRSFDRAIRGLIVTIQNGGPATADCHQ